MGRSHSAPFQTLPLARWTVLDLHIAPTDLALNPWMVFTTGHAILLFDKVSSQLNPQAASTAISGQLRRPMYTLLPIAILRKMQIVSTG